MKTTMTAIDKLNDTLTKLLKKYGYICQSANSGRCKIKDYCPHKEPHFVYSTCHISRKNLTCMRGMLENVYCIRWK